MKLIIRLGKGEKFMKCEECSQDYTLLVAIGNTPPGSSRSYICESCIDAAKKLFKEHRNDIEKKVS